MWQGFVDVVHRVANCVMCGRNAMALQKLLSKTFAGLQPRGCFGWTKNAESSPRKLIHNPQLKRQFGSDHGQIGTHLVSQRQQ